MNESTLQLILEELIKLNVKADAHANDIKLVQSDLKTFQLETREGFTTLNEAIHFIGREVFDNHEARIAVLENK